MCNFKEDDCDRQINEPSPGATCQVKIGGWSCPGKPFCDGCVESCVGQKSEPGACNDADANCNGQVDGGGDDELDGYCDGAMLYLPTGGKSVCAQGSSPRAADGQAKVSETRKGSQRRCTMAACR